VYWYPYWGAFYWMSYGRVIFAVDHGYSTVEADIVDPALDPCQADQPLFGCTGLSDSACFSVVRYDVSTYFGDQNYVTFSDHIWVYRFMYFVIDTDRSASFGSYWNAVLKLSGVPSDVGAMTMSTHLNTWVGNSLISIVRMQSLEQYGYFLTTLDSSSGV